MSKFNGETGIKPKFIAFLEKLDALDSYQANLYARGGTWVDSIFYRSSLFDFDLVRSSFDFSCTPEGYEFWDYVDRAWRKLELELRQAYQVNVAFRKMSNLCNEKTTASDIEVDELVSRIMDTVAIAKANGIDLGSAIEDELAAKLIEGMYDWK